METAEVKAIVDTALAAESQVWLTPSSLLGVAALAVNLSGILFLVGMFWQKVNDIKASVSGIQATLRKDLGPSVSGAAQKIAIIEERCAMRLKTAEADAERVTHLDERLVALERGA